MTPPEDALSHEKPRTKTYSRPMNAPSSLTVAQVDLRSSLHVLANLEDYLSRNREIDCIAISEPPKTLRFHPYSFRDFQWIRSESEGAHVGLFLERSVKFSLCGLPSLRVVPIKVFTSARGICITSFYIPAVGRGMALTLSTNQSEN